MISFANLSWNTINIASEDFFLMYASNQVSSFWVSEQFTSGQIIGDERALLGVLSSRESDTESCLEILDTVLEAKMFITSCPSACHKIAGKQIFESSVYLNRL